jgi:CRISPR-associated exonuclease Cas4
LHYQNRTFAIDFTPALEASLLDILSDMRAQERLKDVSRSHNEPARCRGCGYRNTCDQAMD